MLQLTVDGRILLSFKPPGFFETTKYEKLKVKEVELKNQQEKEKNNDDQLSYNEDDNDDDDDNTNPIATTNVKYSLLALDDENWLYINKYINKMNKKHILQENNDNMIGLPFFLKKIYFKIKKKRY